MLGLINPRLIKRSLINEKGFTKKGFPMRLPRFNTSSSLINTFRLSNREPSLTYEDVRLESKLARSRHAEGYRVYTRYKRKANKVKSMNSDAKDSKVLGGRHD